MNIIIVIPARLNSSRLKRKMLVDIEGEPLIVRTFRQACKARCANQVVVATDSGEIAEVLRASGANVVMTSENASCGTERVAEAARALDGDVYINLQGDEPLIDPANIDRVAEPFLSGEDPDCATLVYPVLPGDFATIDDPHTVKAVTDKDGYALYFSRSPIPYRREGFASTRYYRHLGVYAFRSDVLRKFASMKPSMLEREESLEQLRLLENGFRIRCMKTELDAPGVNTPQDLELVRHLFRTHRDVR
ncbi:3-deoxy-manno-octulosonate cytidylyltransferase [Prosthecochloris sp. GSB1]|uniref:3-deoxy-manno-octulosonate cytidylyltransferase n=1 Tax=Prosthecochloris sp. GSB1 TaxID=281093 RepID=UPI000B8C96C4|nr:3-deoxy-manno-octulosonate cytidylyltransferase [Prosthecochloris sp. GSB1]ASQ91187.1 3-deoxy-manno-octulosonate cytidylyltransferase [Prosthecochloris sp. GSB1]